MKFHAHLRIYSNLFYLIALRRCQNFMHSPLPEHYTRILKIRLIFIGMFLCYCLYIIYMLTVRYVSSILRINNRNIIYVISHDKVLFRCIKKEYIFTITGYDIIFIRQLSKLCNIIHIIHVFMTESCFHRCNIIHSGKKFCLHTEMWKLFHNIFRDCYITLNCLKPASAFFLKLAGIWKYFL